MVQNQSVNTPNPAGVSDPAMTVNPVPSTSDASQPLMDSPYQSVMTPVQEITVFLPDYPNSTPNVINETHSLGGNIMNHIPNLTPELLDRISTSYSVQETLDNMTQTRPLDPFAAGTDPLDNQTNCESNGETYTAPVKSRTRNDSTESIDTLDSNSSSEIFNSAYTDTVSSTASSVYLIKPTKSDEESQEDSTQQAICNDGYMSYSSTEVLNDDDDDDGSQENLLSLETKEENSEIKTALLGDESENLYVDRETDDNNDENLNYLVHHSLPPIQENQVMSFAVEVEPKQYAKITDNLIVADESFLFNSASNLGELEFGKNGKRAITMQNLHERSSFLDLTEISKVGRICQKALVYLKDDMTFGSLASLNTINAKEISKDPMQSLSLISDGKKEGVLKGTNYMKNLIALSVTITLFYIAIGSVRNLQSSINHEGGVGVIGLAVNFVSYMVGSLFSSAIVQNYRPRTCIIVNLIPNLLYIAANLYPTMWVIIPISLVQGLTLAVVSNAISTYITFLAKGSAETSKQSFSEVSGRYFGTFCLIYQSHIIIGNLIASLILQPPADTENLKMIGDVNNTTTMISSNMSNPGNASANYFNQTSSNLSHLALCGPNFCQNFDIGGSRFSVELETKLLLFGVYIGCIILALITAIFFMEPLNKRLFMSTVSPVQKFKSQMSSLTYFFVNVKFLLLLPLLMYSTMQFAFVSAEFIKGYVTCPLGIHMIGYTMICFGICSSVSSYFCGLLNKYLGRIPFIVLASFISLTRKMPIREVLMYPTFTVLLPVSFNG